MTDRNPNRRTGSSLPEIGMRAIQPEGVATAAPFYSPAILAQGQQVLFISGQGPRDYEADIETQIRETFE